MHGSSEIEPDQDVSFDAQAAMLAQFLDALRVDKVDLVGNDSGVGIAQIFAAHHPQRLRTLTLTNGDVHDNWPPNDYSIMETPLPITNHEGKIWVEEGDKPGTSTLLWEVSYDIKKGSEAETEQTNKAIADILRDGLKGIADVAAKNDYAR